MKLHGNVRGEVRVNFLALFASKPRIFMCGALKLSGIVRANVRLNIALVARAIRNAIRANHSRESFAIETPIFTTRQADSHESLEFRIRANHATKNIAIPMLFLSLTSFREVSASF